MTRDHRLVGLIATALVASACSDAPPADGSAARAEPGQIAVPTAAPPPAGALSRIALHVPDISCRLCVRPIEHHLQELGVRDVEVDLETRWVTGRFDPGRLTPDAIHARVEELRFRVAEVRVD